jgi:hypothetical protein
VHDNQKSAQIDLYNSNARTMADALYVGSLVVDTIQPQPKGKPSIEMILASNAMGELSVDAVDMGSSGGEPQHLSVSLVSMTEEAAEGDLRDFELESPEQPPQGLYEKATVIREENKKKGFPWALLVIAVVLLLALGGLLYFFFLNDTGIAIRTEMGFASSAPVLFPVQTGSPGGADIVVMPAPVPPAPVSPDPVVPVISSSPPSGAAVPGAARTNRTRTLPPVASYKVPQTIPRGGAPYTVRWGDTLWDISEAFYRNPWLYRRIARFNNIRNPDLIISGKTIRIPPR